MGEKFPAGVSVAWKCEVENQSSSSIELKSSCRSSKLGPLANLLEINFTGISDVHFKKRLMKALQSHRHVHACLNPH